MSMHEIPYFTRWCPKKRRVRTWRAFELLGLLLV